MSITCIKTYLLRKNNNLTKEQIIGLELLEHIELYGHCHDDAGNEIPPLSPDEVLIKEMRFKSQIPEYKVKIIANIDDDRVSFKCPDCSCYAIFDLSTNHGYCTNCDKEYTYSGKFMLVGDNVGYLQIKAY